MERPLTVLGIETSCDDTGAAVVRDGSIGARILSNVVMSQHRLHQAFGGVVPEIAARAHTEKLDFAVESALDEAGTLLTDIDVIAVTAGPGLIGGLLSGVMLAKGLSSATSIPMVGVNHLAGHALTPRLTDDLDYPFLNLLISGGHCQFIIAQGPDQFERLGGTIDDAPGEAFDKSARALGLDQPGGPAIEVAAKSGDPTSVPLPRPLLDRDNCDMSFSGLKTALVREIERRTDANGAIKAQDRDDIAASFQAAVADILAAKSERAIEIYLRSNPARPAFAVSGGVAANETIRAALKSVAGSHGVEFTAPPLALCTDNAAMIAWAGLELFQAGHRSDLTLAARPRWPLDPSKAPLLGSGKKGAKA
ncbi:MAG: tRNA (adenosine(37)-N6)-threonylcarbamoyltransferase complex transferase subunit TsaD [Pseudomonadota bacterium]